MKGLDSFLERDRDRALFDLPQDSRKRTQTAKTKQGLFVELL